MERGDIACLLSRETLADIIEHALLVKKDEPWNDYAKREDVISYCVNTLSDIVYCIESLPRFLYEKDWVNTSHEYLKRLNFFIGVIGYLVDDDFGRKTYDGLFENSQYHLYDSLDKEGPNQVDIFLEQLGYLKPHDAKILKKMESNEKSDDWRNYVVYAN
jgi:hypothetical protein